MSKKLVFFCVGGCLFLILLSTYFAFALMHFYTRLQMGDVLEKVEIFEQMERQVKTYYPVENATSSMRYALFYYPHSPYQIEGHNGDVLLETLRRNSVRRMVTTLQERFPESNKGNSPFAWIDAYGDIGGGQLDYWKETEWYKKWYADMEY
jgi:hypothetical protein